MNTYGLMSHDDIVFGESLIQLNACYSCLDACKHVDLVDPDYLLHPSHVDRDDHTLLTG